MGRIQLFSIPIYAEKHSRFLEQRQHEIDTRIKRETSYSAALGNSTLPPRLSAGIEDAIVYKWGAWEYNRVVGWLKFSVINGQLEIDVFQHRSTRFYRNARLQYMCIMRREASVGLGHPGAMDISSWVCDHVADIKRRYFKRRWIDRVALDLLVRHIDWLSLMEISCDGHVDK